MKRGYTAAVVLLGLGLGQLCLVRQATAQGADAPKSRAAREAMDRYEREGMKIDAEARASRAHVCEQYVKDLDDARKAAIEKEDLDEAQRILRLKDDLMQDSRLKIIEARFISFAEPEKGLEPVWSDVTEELRKLVKHDKVSVSIARGSPHLEDWPDPAPNKYKHLLVVYSIDGQVRQGVVGPPRWQAEFPEPKKSR